MLSSCLASRPPTWQGVRVAHRRPAASAPTDSKTRAQLLDAAEQLLLEEGYAAVTSGGSAAKAGLEAAARPLLLPHDGRPLPRGLPAPGRGEPRPLRTRRSPPTARCARSGGSTPIRAARRSRWSSSRWRTTARRSAPRSRATPSASAPRRSRRYRAALARRGHHARRADAADRRAAADDGRLPGARARRGARRDHRPRRRRSSSSSGRSRDLEAPRQVTNSAARWWKRHRRHRGATCRCNGQRAGPPMRPRDEAGRPRRSRQSLPRGSPVGDEGVEDEMALRVPWLPPRRTPHGAPRDRWATKPGMSQPPSSQNVATTSAVRPSSSAWV